MAEKRPPNAFERLSMRGYHHQLHIYWIGVLVLVFALDTYLYFKIFDWDAACRAYVSDQSWATWFAIHRGCNAVVPFVANLLIAGILTLVAQSLGRRFKVIES